VTQPNAPAPEHERIARELQDTANRAPVVPQTAPKRWWRFWKRG
jgi:hypothetical protein